MKNLRKIIALFSFIFLIGIVAVIITINRTLDTQEIPIETVKIIKDSTRLSKTAKLIKIV